MASSTAVSTFSGTKLFKSATAGSSWSAVGAGLPGVTTNTVIVDTADAQRVFVGTDIGVYESSDGGATLPWRAGAGTADMAQLDGNPMLRG